MGDVGNLIIISTVSGSISIIASVTILILIFRSDKGLKKLYHRIVFGLCISDILHSTAICFGTIPMPYEIACECQGFTVMLGGIAAPLYVCSICWYYYLSVKHTMRESEIAKKYEVYIHGIPIMWSMTASIVGVATKSIHPDYRWCWIQSSPIGCQFDEELLDNGGECEGRHAYLLRWILQIGPIAVSVLMIYYFMGSIYFTVKRQEEASSRYSFHHQMSNYSAGHGNSSPSPLERQASRSRKVLIRAFSYVTGFFCAYTFSIIDRMIEMYGDTIFNQLITVSLIFYPLQGVYNLIIFIQPTVSKEMDENNSPFFEASVLACQTYGRRDEQRNRLAEREELEVGLPRRRQRTLNEEDCEDLPRAHSSSQQGKHTKAEEAEEISSNNNNTEGDVI